MAKEKIQIKLENIGPHHNLIFNDNISKLQIAIYARNGQGKTFISRSLNTFELNPSLYTSHAKVLLNNDSVNGRFLFKIGEKEYSFNVLRNGITDVKNDLDRIIYTFNSDYIYENFIIKHYLPNSNIQGMIFGKENIDLSAEKKKLSDLENLTKKLKKEILENIEKQKNEIKTYKITNSLSAFKNINYENLLSYHNEHKYDYHKSISEIQRLADMDDEIPNINEIEFKFDSAFSSDEIINLLNEEYTLNNFEDNFKQQIKQHLNFIESGLNEIDENDPICPYCHQPLKNDALDLIHDYIRYVHDQEAIIISKIDLITKNIDEEIEKSIHLISRINQTLDKMNVYKEFFGTIDDTEIEKINISIDLYSNWLSELKNNLLEKKKDISKSIKFISFRDNETIKACLHSINNDINSFNKQKNNISGVKKNLKITICNASMEILHNENSKHIEELSKLSDQHNLLKEEIENKELTTQKDRKKLVANDFERFLSSFFYDKYTLDKDTFTLSLNSKEIENDLDKVLSDGEKTILAFCYYLANIHNQVESENDYQKLLLVIDDPISSVDIDYIYQLVSIIKSYANIQGLTQQKYIILTHNLDFFNLLKRNNIVSKHYLLNEGVIQEYKDELIMPYEFHLLDLYKIANNKKEPTYTTSNSIRHVLETMCQFEGWKKDSNSLEILVKSNEEFTNNLGISSLMHDLSHGGTRFEFIQNREQLINSCKAVIEYINRKYPKQIENCKEIV